MINHCVGCGLQVVCLRKRDFLALDNPLLAWMLDYDAVSAVLKSLPAFKKLKQEQMEHIFDRWGALFTQVSKCARTTPSC
jgi:cGMP-dependent protein kinase